LEVYVPDNVGCDQTYEKETWGFTNLIVSDYYERYCECRWRCIEGAAIRQPEELHQQVIFQLFGPKHSDFNPVDSARI